MDDLLFPYLDVELFYFFCDFIKICFDLTTEEGIKRLNIPAILCLRIGDESTCVIPLIPAGTKMKSPGGIEFVVMSCKAISDTKCLVIGEIQWVAT